MVCEDALDPLHGGTARSRFLNNPQVRRMLPRTMHHHTARPGACKVLALPKGDWPRALCKGV